MTSSPHSDSLRIRRRDLVRLLASRTGLTQKQLQGVFSTLQDIAVEQLEVVGVFELPGLCYFTLRKRRPRRFLVDGRMRHLPLRQVLKAEPVKRLRELFYSLDPRDDLPDSR